MPTAQTYPITVDLVHVLADIICGNNKDLVRATVETELTTMLTTLGYSFTVTWGQPE